jgi:cyclopropane fatty-acyl-phospholipid synthase-like methyltransferase
VLKVAIVFVGLSIALPVGLRAQGQQDHQDHAGQMPDHMEHSFADAEQYAKQFDDPARDAWQMPDRVIAALDLKPGQSVADIGAGTGYFSVRLARTPAAPKVFAVDIEQNMVNYLRARAMKEGLTNIVAVKAAADRSNLPEPVDVVLVVDTFHHIPNRVAYFTALKALIKPGGKLAIIDFKKDAPGEGPPPEFRFTPDQISGELAKAGFALQAQHDFLPRQMYLIYTAK